MQIERRAVTRWVSQRDCGLDGTRMPEGICRIDKTTT